MAGSSPGLARVDVMLVYVVLNIEYVAEAATAVFREMDLDPQNGYIPGQEKQEQKKQHNIPDQSTGAGMCTATCLVHMVRSWLSSGYSG